MQGGMEVPWLFLSHSGAQKDFAWRLYHELLHVGHNPFFDQDPHRSLPKAHDFPSRIIHACCGCKMAVVVISHQYIESKWPMIELEHFVFHNPSVLIYPLFYGLEPRDLVNRDNLRQWQSCWESMTSVSKATLRTTRLQVSRASRQASTSSQSNFNISSWPAALRKLRSISGEIMGTGAPPHAVIQRIVFYICDNIPPPQYYSLDSHHQGGDRMEKDIDNLLEQSGCIINGVCSVVGVYGMGGSGKTSLCKIMANFYNKNFLGRSCLLELPTQNNEAQLLEAIKNVLCRLGQSSMEALHRISTADQAMSNLKQVLKRCKVFLTVDNVWDWSFELASQIINTEYMSGSKIMITSRKRELLRRLQIPTIVPVPSISKEEAVVALMSYSGATSFQDAIPEEDAKVLAWSCFFEGQCHPLMLKAKGAMLKQYAGHMDSAQDWKDLVSCLQGRRIHNDDDLKASVLSVLEASLLELPTRLQIIFLDLVTCLPSLVIRSLLGDHCEWLSRLHEGYSKEDMRYELIRLEYHGLLRIENFENSEVIMIHDLYRAVAANRVQAEADSAQRRWLFEWQISTPSTHEECKYIYTNSLYREEDILRLAQHCSKMEQFILISHLPLKHIKPVQSVFSKYMSQVSLEELQFRLQEYLKMPKPSQRWSFEGQTSTRSTREEHMYIYSNRYTEDIVRSVRIQLWSKGENFILLSCLQLRPLSHTQSLRSVRILEQRGYQHLRPAVVIVYVETSDPLLSDGFAWRIYKIEITRTLEEANPDEPLKLNMDSCRILEEEGIEQMDFDMHFRTAMTGMDGYSCYFKCAVSGCMVRKMVYKQYDDPRRFFFCYLYRHNHPIP